MACRCACGLKFGGVKAFDKHRIGEFEKHDRKGREVRPSTRRCMTAEELANTGLVVSKGVWSQPKPAIKTPAAKIPHSEVA